MKALVAVRRFVLSAAFLKALVFAGLLLGLWWIGRGYDFSLPAMRRTVEGHGLLAGGAVLAGLFAFVTLAPIAGRDILKVVGVVLLGPLVSALAIWAADLVAGVLSFYLAKALGREAIEKLVGRRMAWIDRRLEERGFRNMVILRVLPTPYRYLNFLAGVTRISFRDFFWGTAVGALIRSLYGQFALWPFVDLLVREPSAGGPPLVAIAVGGSLFMVALMFGIYALVHRLWPGFFRVEEPAGEAREDAVTSRKEP